MSVDVVNDSDYLGYCVPIYPDWQSGFTGGVPAYSTKFSSLLLGSFFSCGVLGGLRCLMLVD